MISAISWVPKGASKAVPSAADPPSKEEIEEIKKTVIMCKCCFRSIRFGLEEAHGKGQALQFNWLFEKGAFVLLPDQTFSVNFDKIGDAVEGLSREVLTIQAKGDKDAARLLLEKYCQMTQPLNIALEKLANVEVPVDIAPDFPIMTNLLHKK